MAARSISLPPIEERDHQVELEELEEPIPEYQPIEFLLNDLSDDHLVTWLSDQVSILRSVFTVYVTDEPHIQDTIEVGSWQCRLNRISYDEFEINCDGAINSRTFDSSSNVQAKILHLSDGTALGFLITGGEKLVGYHFCFEQADDDTFTQMIIPSD